MAESKKTTKKTSEAKSKAPKKEAPATKPAEEAAPVSAEASTTGPATESTRPATGETPAAPNAAKKRKVAKAEAPASAAPPEKLSLDEADVEKPKIVKAKGSKNVHSGIAHILSTFNNTIVTITDLTGKVIGWSSAGKVGFKGSRKSTAYAAQMVAQDASRQAMGHGLKEVEVRVKGPGAGRESAVRALQAIGLDLSVIRDVTPVPHNGCRPPKQRRV